MTDVVIVSAARTAIGKFGGALASLSAPELGAIVIKNALERARVEPAQVSEVIMGQVLAAGSGQNPARQSSIKAGIPVGVSALTINKVCGSGLKAVMLGANAIIAGDAEIVVAGGQENMSAAPHLLMGSRGGFRMGDAKLIDSMIVDGIWDAFNQYHMGITAENVAQQCGITRQEQDCLAVASHNKAEAARSVVSFATRLCPWRCRSAKANRSLSATMKASGPAPPSTRFLPLKPRLNPTERLRPATLRGLTMRPLSSCSCRRKKRRSWASNRWRA